jgi:hypothetical protein
MTRSQITSELYESKEIAQVLRKVHPANLREELKQEMFLALCSISDEKFWTLYNSNGVNGVPFWGIYNKKGNAGIRFWLVRCMLNMIYSTNINQPFFKNFRHQHEELLFDSPDMYTSHVTNEEDNNNLEALYTKLESKRAELSWYENELLNTWSDLKFNQKEISRKTGIPYMSVVKTISVIKQKLKSE